MVNNYRNNIVFFTLNFVILYSDFFFGLILSNL